MSSSHDLFVKQILSNTADAIDFFESSLSKSIIDLLDLNHLELRLYMKMIQIIRDDPESFLTNLKDIFYSISKEKDEAKRIYIIKNLLEYLFRARKDAENYTEKEIIKNIEGDYMNLLERIREEGKLEGEQKGKQEGKQENKLETAHKMLEEGFTLTQISKITGLTEIQLRENGIL